MQNKHKLVSLHAPLSSDDMRHACPSIYAQDKRPDRSDKYAYIGTADVLERLADEGFLPFAVNQKRSRKPDGHLYTKHIVRLRHASVESVKGGAPEVCIWNAHDGGSAYIVGLGWLEFVCANGLVVGKMFDAVRVPHSGDVTGKVIDATYTVVEQSKLIADKRDAMLAQPVTDAEELHFCEQAMALRYGEDRNEWKFPAYRLTRVRHTGQLEDNLWNVFNRVQENIVRGGIEGVSWANERPRRMRSRPVTSIDKDRKLNMGLWDLAERLLKK